MKFVVISTPEECTVEIGQVLSAEECEALAGIPPERVSEHRRRVTGASQFITHNGIRQSVPAN